MLYIILETTISEIGAHLFHDFHLEVPYCLHFKCGKMQVFAKHNRFLFVGTWSDGRRLCHVNFPRSA